MTTMYLVGAIGYDYDDNNYYCNDYDAIRAQTIYRSKEKAVAACDALNFSEFKSLFLNTEIREYGDFYNSVDDGENLLLANEVLERTLDCNLKDYWEDREYDLDWLEKPTDEDWRIIYNAINTRWYSVVEVQSSDD